MISLDHLFDRNIAWANRKTEQDPSFFRRLSEQQAPKYLWIGCSDSRITANDVLGLDPGEVFVHRNIANIVHTSDMNILSVLDYAIDVLLGRHIIVAGHYGCGGCSARWRRSAARWWTTGSSRCRCSIASIVVCSMRRAARSSSSIGCANSM